MRELIPGREAQPRDARDQPAVLVPGQIRSVAEWQAMGSSRPGRRGYLCVLAFIAAAPSTSVAVAEAFGYQRQYARELLRRMGELGMAHQVGTERTGRAGPAVPLWTYGRGEILRKGARSRDNWPELVQLAAVLRLLDEGEGLRVRELHEASGSAMGDLRDLLATGKALRLMRIVDWDVPSNPQGGGAPVACWGLGSERDAPRPKPTAKPEIQRRKRQAASARAMTLQVIAALTAGETA